MNKRFLPVFAVVLGAIMMSSTQVLALNNGLARTPPMGFNTWNWFGCRNSSGHGNVTDTMMKQIADAFISKGMAAVGYQYVNIDDCWATLSRDSRGGLVPDSRYYPKGIKSLTDYIHSKGLNVGIYSDIGTSTCATCYGGANPQGLPGMQGGFAQRDCDSFVAWGFDYLKLDFCCFSDGSASAAYAKVRDALKASVTRMKPTVPDAHPITFSVCEWGSNTPWLWGDTVGNLWRTTNDIGWQWNSLMAIVDKNAPLYPYARVGSWNDPDMLEIGNGDFATNYPRNRSHMSLWCIMSSALLAGNDIRTMNDSLRLIMTNKDVIDINQDTLGGDTTKGIIQGRRVVSGNSEVWVKLLKGKTKSEYAVLFFNRGNSGAVNISVTTAQIASVGGDMASGKQYLVRDLWKHTNLANWTAGGTLSTPAAVGVNDVHMVRLSLPPVSAVPPLAKVKVTDMRVQSEGERVIVRSARSERLSIRLMNLKGEVVYSQRLTGPMDCSISTKGLPRGMYIVNVRSAKERLEQKVFLK
jgi:alpha-galactosidase